MCTLSFVPTEAGTIITANRDEAPARNASGLSKYKNERGESFLIAKEPLRGGTNLAIGEKVVSVLLNGAFEYHESKLSYRRSRGLIVLDSLNFASLAQFTDRDLEGVEPFTLVRFGDEIEELRWDEEKIHLRKRDSAKPFIIASAKLYSKEVQEKRQNWFRELLHRESLDAYDLLRFHLEGGDGDPENDMVMNRGNMVRTVSVSQIAKSSHQEITHRDLINGEEQNFKQSLQ